MKILFEDKDLEELIVTGKNHKYRKYARNKKFMKSLAISYSYMRSVDKASELKIYSFMHYEVLKHIKDKTTSSIRPCNGMVERIIFQEIENGIIINILELNSDHYGNKK